MRIEATGDVPVLTAKKLAGRVFRIPPYLGDALVAKREALVRKTEKAPEPEPVVEEEAPVPEPPPVPDAAVAAEANQEAVP